MKHFKYICFTDPDSECDNCNSQGGGDCTECDGW